MDEQIKQAETTTQATPKRRRNAAETAAFKGKLLELVEARPGITGAEATQAVGEDAASTLSNMAKSGMIVVAKADAKSVRGIPFNGYYPKVQTAQAATSRTAEIMRGAVSDTPIHTSPQRSDLPYLARISVQSNVESVPTSQSVDAAISAMDSVIAAWNNGEKRPSDIETLTKEKEIRVARLAELREQIRRAVEKKKASLLAEIASLDAEESELRKRLEELA